MRLELARQREAHESSMAGLLEQLAARVEKAVEPPTVPESTVRLQLQLQEAQIEGRALRERVWGEMPSKALFHRDFGPFLLFTRPSKALFHRDFGPFLLFTRPSKSLFHRDFGPFLLFTRLSRPRDAAERTLRDVGEEEGRLKRRIEELAAAEARRAEAQAALDASQAALGASRDELKKLEEAWAAERRDLESQVEAMGRAQAAQVGADSGS